MHPSQFPTGGLDMPSRTTWYILTPTLAVSGLLLAVGLSGAWYVHQVNRDVSDSLHEMLAAAQTAERLVLAIRDVRVKLHRFVNDGDTSHLDDAELSLAVIESALGSGEVAVVEDDVDDDPWPKRLPTLRERLRGLRGVEAGRDEARTVVALLDEGLLAPAERVLNR